MVALAGCASQPPAPIEQIPTATDGRESVGNQVRPPSAKKPAIQGEIYRVQAGDTLYSIAWRLGVDFRQLVEWNGITDPHHIVVGQVLRVQPTTKPRPPSGTPQTSSVMAAPVPHPTPKPGEQSAHLETAPATRRTKPATVNGHLTAQLAQWEWPTDGKAVRAVSATGSIGLEIRGARGQSVRAANNGQVVYAGSGLRGYGQLLIVKHDESFLSAYAHNDKLLVAEGQQVRRGQAIALMGDSGASEVMLHFEIRKGGKAVEPLQYLPKQ